MDATDYPTPKKAKDATGRAKSHTPEAESRREAIWSLIRAGVPEWKITKAVVEEYGCSDRTVRRDLQVLGERVRAELGPDEVDRRGFACLERIEAIAIEAQTGKTPEGNAARKDLRVALQANVHLARLLGVKDERWRQKVELQLPASDRSTLTRLAAGLEEIAELTDTDLLAERGRLQERLGALRVLPGGREDDPPGAKRTG